MPSDSTLQLWNPGTLETLKYLECTSESWTCETPNPEVEPFKSPGTPLAEIAKLLMLGNNNFRRGVVYALGRTKGCSKYSKAENNKTPPLYKYVEGLRDTHMTNCVNRLRNHDGLKIAETT